MKRLLILCFCLALLATGFIFFKPEEAVSAPVPVDPTVVVSAQALSQEATFFDDQIFLQVQFGDEVRTLSMKEYLIGVLLSEVPSDFPAAALEAQTVASRTFALKQANAEKHPRAHVCTDFACCQGWIAPENFSSEAVNRVSAAVAETDGLVLTYEGALIDATFFSCSGGSTEAAVAVWGAEVPYLQAVESPGEEDAPRFTETVCLDQTAFSETLLGAYPEANLSGSPGSWFGVVSYTPGSGIDHIFIGGVAVSGTQLRSLFSLRSTAVSIEVHENQIYMTTWGFGHRVGMSQYGAKAMAETGANFQEILLHYYQDTRIVKLLCSEKSHESTAVLSARGT